MCTGASPSAPQEVDAAPVTDVAATPVATGVCQLSCVPFMKSILVGLFGVRLRFVWYVLEMMDEMSAAMSCVVPFVFLVLDSCAENLTMVVVCVGTGRKFFMFMLLAMSYFIGALVVRCSRPLMRKLCSLIPPVALQCVRV